MDELIYWIWLSLCCTPDSATFPSLLKRFKTAKEVYDAEDREITSALVARSSDRNLLVNKDLARSREILDFCNKYNVGLLPYSDEKYPKSLREIKTPPVLLYYRGALPDFDKGTRIAVVGTRKLSDYGRKNAFTIARDLAISGATIVSGMAIGIDGVAMAGALSADAPTVAVIGSGIDVCYPSEHLTLAREIVKRGCVITEYPPKSPPDRFNFPKRNRIISGLSSATLVIEGKEKSGAMITARYARSQGRTLYALPGSVGNPNSELTNLLIKNGAKMVTSADDIVRDFSDGKSKELLNPFKLTNIAPVDMFSYLKEYKVSCVAPSDDVFKPKVIRKREEVQSLQATEPEVQNAASISSQEIENSVLNQFNKDILNIYKKIPAGNECEVESLVDEVHSLRDIMRALLKLEIGKFVTMLPGGRVKRNI